MLLGLEKAEERDQDPRPPGRSHSAPRRPRRDNREQGTLSTNTRPHSPIRTRTTTETVTILPHPLPRGDSAFRSLCREEQLLRRVTWWYGRRDFDSALSSHEEDR